MKRLLTIFILLFVFFSVAHATYAAQTFDMGTAANWNVRFTGPAYSAFAAGTSLVTADIDNNGTKDIIIGDWAADNNSRTDSGSLFVIKNELFSSITATGNSVDLTNPSNYSYRFDGAAADEWTSASRPAVKDINNNGIPDLIIQSSYNTANGRSYAGSVYIIYDSILSAYTGTGNNFDLASASSYSVRIDGAADEDYFGYNITVEDVNGDGKQDLLAAASYADNNSRADSGSIYLLYNSLIGNFSGTGNTVDISNTSKWSIRFDGAVAGHILGETEMTAVDYDHNATTDILLGVGEAGYNSKATSGSLYFIKNELISGLTGTGNTVDMSTSTKWNLRIDGATAGDTFGRYRSVEDINGNNVPDILVSANSADYNSRSGSGSVYIIYDDIISSYSGTGNTFQMSDTTKWNIRFDGRVAGDTLGVFTVLASDVNNDGVRDIILTEGNGDINGFTNNNSVFIIFNDIFEDLTGTGNTLDLLSSSNFSIRYDGEQSNTYLGSSIVVDDINGDGADDLLISSPQHTTTAPSRNGFLYLIYYFPHTITHTETVGDIRNPFTFKGLVNAPNSPTTITRVQWGHNRSFGNLTATVASDFENAWIDCTADDGTFDSISERFSCAHSGLDGRTHFTIPHDVFIRAQDSKGVWTPVSNYLQHTFSLPTSPVSTNSNTTTQTAQVLRNEGRILRDTGGGSNTALVVVSENTLPFDSSLSVDTFAKKIPQRVSSFWQIGESKRIYFRSFFNNALIMPFLLNKTSIVSLSYSDSDLIPAGKPKSRYNAKTFRLAYSTDGKKWKILPTSVVDTKNKTVAALHKVGGYYMIVGR